MKTYAIRYKKLLVEIICLLFILLFVYAAVSKLLDFNTFQNQLGQSPLLSTYAGIVSWAVPILEILIAILLCIRLLKPWGLYATFTLMVMFSVYIYIILNYASFVPCSCGGVLEKMGWEEHLIFNLCFVLLAILGIMLLENKKSNQQLTNTIIAP